MACKSGNENLVKYLVELKGDITIKNKRVKQLYFVNAFGVMKK